MFHLSNAESRNIESLQNWLNGNVYIARNERAYLKQPDLVSLAVASDSALVQLESWIEDRLVSFYSGFCKVRAPRIVAVSCFKN